MFSDLIVWDVEPVLIQTPKVYFPLNSFLAFMLGAAVLLLGVCMVDIGNSIVSTEPLCTAGCGTLWFYHVVSRAFFDFD
jgi:hypothetical protein